MVLKLKTPLLNQSHRQYSHGNDNYGTHDKITSLHHLYNFYKKKLLK